MVLQYDGCGDEEVSCILILINQLALRILLIVLVNLLSRSLLLYQLLLVTKL